MFSTLKEALGSKEDDSKAAVLARTADILSRMSLTGRILTGWIGVPAFSAAGTPLPFPQYFQTQRTHPPQSLIRDSRDVQYVIWHEGSMRRTSKVAAKFVHTLQDKALRSADPDVREAAGRTLAALRKDIDAAIRQPLLEKAVKFEATVEDVAAASEKEDLTLVREAVEVEA